MKDDYKISVITPFYNGNRYMDQLFTVIQRNNEKLKTRFSHSEIELILVNDSPEIEIAVPACKADFQYRIIEHASNSGIHQARITGLSNCNGDYVLFLDQDDVLEDGAIRNQLEELLSDNADAVICNAYMEEAKGSSYLLYRTRTDFKLINNLEFYLKSHNIIKSPGQCLLKKSIIPEEWKNYIMHRNGSDDLFLWILLLEKNFRFSINKKPLYIHKYTGENLSDSEMKMSQSSLEIAEYMEKIDYVPNEHVQVLKKARLFSTCLYQKNTIRKIKAVICYPDLVLYLAVNKIMRMFI